MKKSLLFLSLLSVVGMVSCGQSKVDRSKVPLKYGTITKNPIASTDELEITYSYLSDLVGDKESFVLLIFHSRSCGCWKNELGPVALQFMNTYNVRFYAFDNALLEDKSNTFGIYTRTENVPGICFFKNGKLLRQSIYGKMSGKQREIFKVYEKFESYMLENIYLPKMYYIDKDILEEKMSATTGSFNLYVALKDCPDCNAVDANYISSWASKNKDTTINDVLYIFDIYPYDNPSEEPNIRDYCHLSTETNPKFGYTYTKHGYVPTFQRWENGEIIDMITVLNDFADKETGLVTSYFSQERIANSPILSRSNYIAYHGTTISTDLVNPWGTVKQEEQLKWHLPAVKSFFDEYVK